jgi:hypothetical protein
LFQTLQDRLPKELALAGITPQRSAKLTHCHSLELTL